MMIRNLTAYYVVGRVTGDIAGLDVALRQMQQEFRGALQAIQSVLPSTLAERSSSALLRGQADSWNSQASGFHEHDEKDGAESPATERAQTPTQGSALNSARAGSPQNTGRPSSPPTFGLPYEDSEVSGESSVVSRPAPMLKQDGTAAPADEKAFRELPDIAQGNYSVQRVQLLKDMVSDRLGVDALAASTQKRLKEEHHVYLSAETGRLLTSREIENLLNPKPQRSKTTKGGKRGTSAASRRGDDSTEASKIAQQNSAVADSRVGSRGDQLSTRSDDLHMGDLDTPKRGGTAASGANTTGLGATTAGGRVTSELPPITYNASKLAAGTLQAELYPLTQTFGRDQATLWIEWAISKAGALSFGFLGQSCLDPMPDTGFSLSRANTTEDGSMAEEFLQQVRARLLDLESALSSPGEHSKLSNVKGIRIEARVVNFVLLFKVTVQLGLKKEAGQCLMQLEDACATLRKQQCDSLDSIVYHALAMRFRLDYEEWTISHLVSDAWMLSHLVNRMLPLCRQYRNLCALTGDVVLQRDAIKRQINLYSQIGAIPVSDESDVIQLSSGRVTALTSVELEAHEQNVEWLQKHGAIRAGLLFEEMVKLAESALAH
jgi:hypothetical protein